MKIRAHGKKVISHEDIQKAMEEYQSRGGTITRLNDGFAFGSTRWEQEVSEAFPADIR